MKLHEYQAKEILAKAGLPVTPGMLVKHLSEIDEFLKNYPEGPWVVKAQIHAGGRGKAGGVKLAKSEVELRQKASDILGMTLVSPQTGPQGKLVKKIFMTPAVDYSQELYVSVVLDRVQPLSGDLGFRRGRHGDRGIGRPQARGHPKGLCRPHRGPSSLPSPPIALDLGLPKDKINQGAKLFKDLVTLFMDLDLSMVEVNPLVVLKDGKLHCLDAKMAFEDNGLARHKEYAFLAGP